jgi:hypothetical protein
MLGTMITNRVMTSNEARQVLGMKPADDPNADKLTNPNVDTVENAASPNEDSKQQKDQKDSKEVVNQLVNEGENQNVEKT